MPDILRVTERQLIQGDPMEPNGLDMILEWGRLLVGHPVPPRSGWRVMTGNDYDSLVSRVVYRHEIDPNF